MNAWFKKCFEWPGHFHFHKEAFLIPFTFNRAVVLCTACDSQVQRRGGCGWTVTTLSMNYSLGQIFQQLYRGSTASSVFFSSLSLALTLLFFPPARDRAKHRAE